MKRSCSCNCAVRIFRSLGHSLDLSSAAGEGERPRKGGSAWPGVGIGGGDRIEGAPETE